MSNRSDSGSESTTIVHASLWRSAPSKKNILKPLLQPGKYFLYIFCSLAKTVSFYICDPVWLCLVLSNSARFMPSGTMTFNANVREIPFSRPNVPKSIQPRSQGLSSYRLLERARRDPGRVWSRVSQNLGDDNSIIEETGGLIFREHVAFLHSIL